MDKTYAGRRLRRLREDRGLSQAALARRLSVSPSYLNQIEHDSRPLTVPVLLRLCEEFGVDAGFFAAHDVTRLIAEIREVVADGALASPEAAGEAAELAEKLPHTARALVTLHRRYRQALEQLALLTDGRASDAPAPQIAMMPHEEARDYFYRRHNYIAELDDAAERVAAEIGARPGQMLAALDARLARHGIQVVGLDAGSPSSPTNPGEQHRYDDTTKRLYLAGHLRPGQQAFRMAVQLAFAEYADLITDLAADDELSSPPAVTLTRVGLANYFAAAVIMPYRAVHATAERYRYDIERLADHFGVGFETVCHRLSTLQRPRLRGVPFSFIRVDRAGNMSKRSSATGFHFTRTGSTCPLWNVYEAFAAPGRILVQIASMPDNSRYLWVARTVTRTPGRYGAPGKTFAVGLGCDVRHADRLVYAAGRDLDDRDAAVPIGVGCKVCDREGCPQRAFPQIGRSLAVSENRSTFAPYPHSEPGVSG
ncbi:short-chain fatty acyl-CoA regulator family protein [Virgisporangium ochraceum]|uniref:XRE family transcriptional regulator n=1 Tax=Virgisporangium ochraceum TaxID=65505 RepID=A0A8J4EBA7_9ACTN|nr:short-chain fatty acyl-CoA regulator family protein [Virgisporangium ochraceum]GIJ68394.1 XRE family transcriptional regulator [Virgisporangium ochraceum]